MAMQLAAGPYRASGLILWREAAAYGAAQPVYATQALNFCWGRLPSSKTFVSVACFAAWVC
jgi:hypothetical protein